VWRALTLLGGLTGAGRGWLRIRRSQVRVLPSAPQKYLPRRERLADPVAASLKLRPVLDPQVRHALELAGIVGDERDAHAHRVGCDQGV
jgi:hypothetical protein